MNVDLFCKTCRKDAEWFQYMVRSVDRFASGFRKFVVVADDDCDLAEMVAMCPAKPDSILTFADLPEFRPEYGFNSPKILNYYYASAIKTVWTEFTDADAVVWIDSDSMFTRPITPAWWFDGDRPIWWRVPWTESKDGCAAWKRGVDHFFGFDSQNENMCVSAGLATREATIELHEYIRLRWRQTVREYYLTHPPSLGIGEYTMLGGYLEFINECDYVIQHPKDLKETWPVRQFWSWDPKGPPRDEMERILAP